MPLSHALLRATLGTLALATAVVSASASSCPGLKGQGENYAAALCIGLRESCNAEISHLSGFCRALTPAHRQPRDCKKLACAFCECKPAKYVCGMPAMVETCKLKRKPLYPAGSKGKGNGKKGDDAMKKKMKKDGAKKIKDGKDEDKRKKKNAAKKSVTKDESDAHVNITLPTNMPAPSNNPKPSVSRRPAAAKKPMSSKRPQFSSPKPPKKKEHAAKSGAGCVRKGRNGHVAIPVASSPNVRKPWERVGNCLVWKPKSSSRRIDKRGSTPICYRFQVDMQSKYFFTAITKAPHGTEHNDMWVSFPDGGFRLKKIGKAHYRPGKFSGWLKAYQNKGRNMHTSTLKTIDFNGHHFETDVLKPARTYTVCIAGRSSKFNVCTLHFVACAGKSCKHGSAKVQKAVASMSLSPCA